MTISLQPPPIQIPKQFAADAAVNGFFSALLNTIYQIWIALYSIRTQSKITTTDATNTEIFSVLVDTNKTVMIQASIVARRTGGGSGTVGDSAWYFLLGAYKNIGGVLTGIGAPSLTGGEDQAGWNVSFTSAGSNAIVQVTGAAGNNITWEGTLSAYTVGA